MAFSFGQAGASGTSQKEQLIPVNGDIDVTRDTNTRLGDVDNSKYASVEFLDLFPGKVFYKKSYRYMKESSQRVIKEQCMVHLRARTTCQLYRIFGWVKRAVPKEVADGIKDRNGEVPIKSKATGTQSNLLKDTDIHSMSGNGCFLVPFSVDLHDIYEGNPGAGPVFKLHKWDPDGKINIFQLIIQLEFIDKTRSQKFYSPIFNLRTEFKAPTERRRQIIVESLNARAAEIDTLVAHNLLVETPRADLAYHWTLKEPDKLGDMEEGDIVGFYEDAKSSET